MEFKRRNSVTGSTEGLKGKRNFSKTVFILFSVFVLSVFITSPASAHCDSYDGPVIQDALKAFETNNVNLVFKWIDENQEPELPVGGREWSQAFIHRAINLLHEDGQES